MQTRNSSAFKKECNPETVQLSKGKQGRQSSAFKGYASQKLFSFQKRMQTRNSSAFKRNAPRQSSAFKKYSSQAESSFSRNASQKELAFSRDPYRENNVTFVVNSSAALRSFFPLPNLLTFQLSTSSLENMLAMLAALGPGLIPARLSSYTIWISLSG
jgi:hypothetical protein